MKKILLIDGNSLIFRAYYASAYKGYILKTSSGIPTNGVYSFANMVTSLVSEREYYDVKVAFDKGKKTFRHEKLADYKGGRSTTPLELVTQFPIAREFLDAANIEWFELENYEADDLIGTLVKQAELEDDIEIEILTSDKDMFQLISDKTKVLIPKTGVSSLEIFGKDQLFEKWNISPNQVPDLKGLMGDASDNLKGVEGVGEKTAIKLISEYSSIENVYQNIEKIKGVLQAKLIKDKNSALLCKEIATIFCDIELSNLIFQKVNINIQGMIKFLEKYEMHSLVKRLSFRGNTINNCNALEIEKDILTYEVIENFSFSHVSDINYIYFESLQDNYHKGKIQGIALSNSKGRFIIKNWEKNNIFQEFLNDKKFKKITYDIKKSFTLLTNHSLYFNLESFVFDHMVAGYVLNPNIKSTIQNLSIIAEQEFSIIDDEIIYGKGAKKTFNVDENLKNRFLIDKVSLLEASHWLIIDLLEKNNQTQLYQEIEFPLIKVLFAMEQSGISIDKTELEKQTIRTLQQIEEVEISMLEVLEGKIDEGFNFSSPKQVKELLYDRLELTTQFNKKHSTDKESLEKLINQHPVIELLIQHRKLSKLYSTYLRGFEKFIFEDDKIHTIFNQTLTNTGRLSSSEPNIQNISVKDDQQKEARKIFIAQKGSEFVSFDYSQIELRVLAQMGNEDTLIEIFKNKRDVHTEAARLIFKLDDGEKVSLEQRRTAKVFNFGIIYGLTDYGLSQDLNISIKQASTYIDKYYKGFPKLNNFKLNLVNEAEAIGFSVTIANRRRVIEELKSSNHQVREFGKRVAVNMPIQGSAADILKVAMVNIDKQIKANLFESKMIAQIHDEIIFEIKLEEKEQVMKIVELEMKMAFEKLLKIVKKEIKIVVDLEVNVSQGKNWYELK